MRLTRLLALFLGVLCFCSTVSMLWAADTTPALTVKTLFSQEGDVQPSEWKLTLEFNRPVALLDLTRHLIYTVNGKARLLKITNVKNADTEAGAAFEGSRFRVEPKEKVSAVATAALTLAAALPASDGPGTLGTAMKLTFGLQNFAFVSKVECLYVKGDEHPNFVRFSCSADIPPEKLKSQVRILPPIGKIKVVRIEGESPEYRISGTFQNGKTYWLQVL